MNVGLDQPLGRRPARLLVGFCQSLLLEQVDGLAMSPSTCSSARLHSMIPAPLFSRSSLTWLAVTTIYHSPKCGNVRQSNCMTNMSRPRRKLWNSGLGIRASPEAPKLCLGFAIGSCSHVRNYQSSAAIFVGREKLREV